MAIPTCSRPATSGWSISPRTIPITFILGTHIEQTRTPFVDYPVGTVYQPDEHVLELGVGHLLELNDALKAMGDGFKPQRFADFSVCGHYPTCEAQTVEVTP